MEPQKSAWDWVDDAARAIGITSENLRKMHDRGAVPPRWHAQITRKLAEMGIQIDLEFFERLTPLDRPKRRANGSSAESARRPKVATG